MARKPKGPTIPELRESIRRELREWKKIRRSGAGDPSWPDGTNMNLVRNHVIYYQGELKKLCREQKVRPCPGESKAKPPRLVADGYCAPRSKSGPCRERRAAARRKKRRIK